MIPQQNSSRQAVLWKTFNFFTIFLLDMIGEQFVDQRRG